MNGNTIINFVATFHLATNCFMAAIANVNQLIFYFVDDHHPSHAKPFNHLIGDELNKSNIEMFAPSNVHIRLYFKIRQYSQSIGIHIYFLFPEMCTSIKLAKLCVHETILMPMIMLTILQASSPSTYIYI